MQHLLRDYLETHAGSVACVFVSPLESIFFIFSSVEDKKTAIILKIGDPAKEEKS